MPTAPEPVRRPAVAGTWYPATSAAIEAEVDRYLGAVANPWSPERLVALLSPHAGLRYSGPVAAHAYHLLRTHPFRSAVLVGPSHHMAFEGVSIWSRGAFETPLGTLPIDEELAAALLASSDAFFDDPLPHRKEHSLEMQLPFLQRVLPGLRIVPALMGSQSRAEVERLSDALARCLPGRDALLIASSDLSHYHPAPEANRLDADVIHDVEHFDAARLMDRLEHFRGHACGGGPLVAVMRAASALGATRGIALRYGDSGDAGERDKCRVVGYLAAAFTA